MSALFPIPELLMLGLFVAGLVWLVVEMALRDPKSLETMLQDTEAFARERPRRPAFQRLRFGSLRSLSAMLRIAAARLARRS